RIVGLLHGHVLGTHSLAPQSPVRAAVLGEPDAAGRHGDPYALGIAGVDADGMNAGKIRATADPFFAQRMIPELSDHLPARSVVGRTEQAAWKRPAPNDALLVTTAGRERPDFGGAPIHRPTPHVDLLVTFGLGRIGGRRDLFPA